MHTLFIFLSFCTPAQRSASLHAPHSPLQHITSLKEYWNSTRAISPFHCITPHLLNPSLLRNSFISFASSFSPLIFCMQQYSCESTNFILILTFQAIVCFGVSARRAITQTFALSTDEWTHGEQFPPRQLSQQ